MKIALPQSLAFRTVCGSIFMATLAAASPLATPNTADYTNPEETLPDSGNLIDVALGYASPQGNEAAYLTQVPLKKHYYGGIERFQYYGYIGRYTELSVEGRALVDNNDYLLDVEFLNEEVGYLDINYKEYRIWYDGSGDYFPGSDTFIQLFDDELALDRTRFHIGGGLFLENFPDLHLSYTLLAREGLKSSTASADTTRTGGFGTRNIVPTFWDIDEKRHIFEVKAEETFGETEATFALRSENSETDNARNINRRPGESSDRKITHREKFDSDLFSARAITITKLNEKNTLTTGILYTEIDVNATGDRIIGSDYDAPYDVDFQGQRRDHGWIDLMADSQIDQWLVNANLLSRPNENWKAIYSLRLEEKNTGIDSDFVETEFSTSSNQFEEHDIELNADRDWNDASAKAELIYTGEENAVYNASLLYQTGDGDFLEEEFDAETSEQLLERLSNTDRKTMKFALGAKFYPSSGLRIFTQYYHKERDYDFDHIIDPTDPDGGNRFPSFTDGQDFTTDDINVSVRWKRFMNLSGITRVDFQKSKIESHGQELEWATSYDREAIVLSQSVTLAFEKFFIQASGVYTDDHRESPVSTIGGGVADTVVVLEGDFWNANLNANWSITDESSAAIGLFYNRTDNYVDNSEFGQPYGEDLRQRGATATYTRKLTDMAQLTLRYSYVDSVDAAAGGFNDYDAHIGYSSIRYRF